MEIMPESEFITRAIAAGAYFPPVDSDDSARLCWIPSEVAQFLQWGYGDGAEGCRVLDRALRELMPEADPDTTLLCAPAYPRWLKLAKWDLETGHEPDAAKTLDPFVELDADDVLRLTLPELWKLMPAFEIFFDHAWCGLWDIVLTAEDFSWIVHLHHEFGLAIQCRDVLLRERLSDATAAAGYPHLDHPDFVPPPQDDLDRDEAVFDDEDDLQKESGPEDDSGPARIN